MFQANILQKLAQALMLYMHISYMACARANTQSVDDIILVMQVVTMPDRWQVLPWADGMIYANMNVSE